MLSATFAQMKTRDFKKSFRSCAILLTGMTAMLGVAHVIVAQHAMCTKNVAAANKTLSTVLPANAYQRAITLSKQGYQVGAACHPGDTSDVQGSYIVLTTTPTTPHYFPKNFDDVGTPLTSGKTTVLGNEKYTVPQCPDAFSKPSGSLLGLKP